jgi:cellulose synthase/poly-beta-1,6-N-acetylglucosamine synthase-like glycosyltransferase
VIKDLVTILVPIYNETQGVEQLLKKTEKLKINKEIIVLNDGSTNPKTLQILTDLKSHFPKIIFYDAKKNNGKTKVITQGIRMASGNICVILDSDSELDPTDITHLYAELKKKDAHFVNGIRYLPHHKHPWNISYAITQASRIFFGAVMRLFLGVRIVDVMCGYKMFYTADFVKYTFSSSRFGLETELLGETIRRKRKIIQVPVRYYPRTYKEGKKIQLHDGVEVLRGLLNTSSRYAITKLMATCLFLFFIVFFSFNISVSYFDTTDSAPTNYTALNIIFNRRLDLSNLKSDIARAGIISTTVTNSS